MKMDEKNIEKLKEEEKRASKRKKREASSN
jgi:hypothetical protein